MTNALTLRTNEEQKRAANPFVSVWATANAGTGKTKVLIDRIARILLTGAEPSKILAVTYTKAAAAEMTTRLFKTLGRWTICSNTELHEILQNLDPDFVYHEEKLSRARTLFARALETPGGLKVQTIHAFCGDVLKRFPIEAGVNPNYEVADEIMANAIKARAFDNAVKHAPMLFNSIAAITNLGDDKKILEIAGRKIKEGFVFDRARERTILSQKFGFEIFDDIEQATKDALSLFPKDLMKECADILMEGKITDQNTAQNLLAIMYSAPLEAYELVLSMILTAARTFETIRKKPPVTKEFVNSAAIKRLFGIEGENWLGGYFAKFFDAANKIESHLFMNSNVADNISAWTN